MVSNTILDAMLDKWIEQKKKEAVFNGEIRMGAIPGSFMMFVAPPINLDNVDFQKRKLEHGGETFSKMLLRLINESGEKPSTIYKRANIERRHFYKIINHENYQPSKQTALAFAIALHLDFDKAQKFLATAGYTIGNSLLSDYIVSFFIEYKIFDVDLINQYFYGYGLPLLGG